MGNAFDGRYLRSIDLGHGHETTVYYLAVDDDGARATLALATAFLCAGKLQLFPQHVEQPRHRKHLDPARFTVDCEGDLHKTLDRIYKIFQDLQDESCES